MSLHDNEKTRRKILDRIVEDNSKWVDEQFGQVDMSDFVDFSRPAPEASFHDDKYSMPDTSGTGLAAKALHEFLDSPDLESLEQAANETGQPDLVGEVLDQQAGATSEEFLARNPDYYSSDNNYFALLNQIRRDAGIHEEIDAEEMFARGIFTVAALERAYRRLLKAGLLEVRPGTLRALTAEQKQRCEFLASRGDTAAAVIHYVWYRLGEKEARDISEAPGANPWKFLQKPEFRSLFEEAAFWAFEQITPDWIPTKDRIAFLKKHTANRWATAALYAKAWVLCKKSEEGQARHDLVFGHADETADQTPMSFDDLTDQQISDLKSRTLQQHAQNIMNQKRRGRGIK